MSTRSSLFYAQDEDGKECHVYWELAERTAIAAPIFIEIQAGGRELTIRLPAEIATQIRDVLAPRTGPDDWDVI